VADTEIVAVGSSIRAFRRRRKQFGRGRWRKLKGRATGLADGRMRRAGIHRYEAHGIGKRKLKFKRFVDESGEDYLYPSEYFVPVEVPPKATSTLQAAGLLKVTNSPQL
jgi:hypothetical protein